MRDLPLATTILLAVLILIATLLAFIATRPSAFRIERNAQVDAPRDIVCSLINDFHNWGLWSP